MHAAVLAVVRAGPARQPQREGQRASWGVVAAASVAAAAVVLSGGAGMPYAYVEASLEQVSRSVWPYMLLRSR